PTICINPTYPYCDEVDDTCEVCIDDGPCDNGLACDGEETCVMPGDGSEHYCQDGAPVQCPPDEACIGYTCVEPGGDCAPE
ncbi:MAG: hypothetical protein JSU63_09685, partial [Phycisphaerales bacterium]